MIGGTTPKNLYFQTYRRVRRLEAMLAVNVLFLIILSIFMWRLI